MLWHIYSTDTIFTSTYLRQHTQTITLHKKAKPNYYVVTSKRLHICHVVVPNLPCHTVRNKVIF